MLDRYVNVMDGNTGKVTRMTYKELNRIHREQDKKDCKTKRGGDYSEKQGKIIMFLISIFSIAIMMIIIIAAI